MFCLHACMCTVWVQCPWRPECQVPKTGVTGHCEPHVGAGNPSPVPEKANALNY